MIHDSVRPPIDVPEVSLTEHVLGRARSRAEATAMVDAISGERLTYGELADRVARGAAGLGAIGIGAGDVVAVLSHNQPAYPVAVHAVLAAGGTVTPLNPGQTAQDHITQVTMASATAIVTASASLARAREVAAATGIEHVLVMDAEAQQGAPALLDLGPAQAGLPLNPVAIDPDSVAMLPFSSGTTGLPKGVMLTHRNLVANLAQTAALWTVDDHDVLTGSLPFFHIYGFTVILNSALYAGATVVTLGKYSLPDYLGMVQEHRVTRAYFAPPMVLQIATDPAAAGFDLSSVEVGICGAAPLDTELSVRAEERLGAPIRQGYGMTEASPGTHCAPDAEFAAIPAGSVGRLFPSTQARIVDPGSLTDAEPGEPGELWVRGPQVMKGYLGDEGSTAETIVEDGWLRTGDVVRVDEDGIYWVVDRFKELIKVSGFQVAPAELEALLLTHPDVVDAAVLGVPDERMGEAPKAFVVTARDVSGEALMEWVAERVTPYKKIREVEIIAEIPKSPTGKILRRLLKH